MVLEAHANRPADFAPRAPAPGPASAAEVAPLDPQEDERELRAAALSGMTDAWNALIRKHDRRVMVALLARGLRVDRARDIAQQTWLKLIEQQRAGKLTHLNLPGLALAQASFLACDDARRDATARRVAPMDLDDARARDVVDPTADAETRLLGTERLARAEAVLAGCSASAQQVFRLSYGDAPLSYDEVAARTGLSPQRVRQIVCEVRKLLRAAFVDGGER